MAWLLLTKDGKVHREKDRERERERGGGANWLVILDGQNSQARDNT